MGLLDELIGSALGKSGGAQGGLGDLLGGLLGGRTQEADGSNMLAALLPVVLALLQNRGSGGSGSGLEDLLGRLRTAGLDRQADSWVGTGENLPVSAQDLAQALGPERLHEIAAQAGVADEQASAGLASILPGLVDRLTPRGQLPAQNDVDDALGSLQRSLGL